MADAALRVDRAMSVLGLSVSSGRAVMYDTQETMSALEAATMTMDNISQVWQNRGDLPVNNVAALQAHLTALARHLAKAKDEALACYHALHGENKYADPAEGAAQTAARPEPTQPARTKAKSAAA